MITKLKKRSSNPPVEPSNQISDNFDFDLWAKAVKQQLLAALQKNSEQSDG